MTGKEKAAYLSRYKKLERHLDQKVEELARWRSRAEKVTPPLLGAGDRQTGDRVAFAVEKIIDIEEEIAADMAQISGVRRGDQGGHRGGGRRRFADTFVLPVHRRLYLGTDRSAHVLQLPLGVAAARSGAGTSGHTRPHRQVLNCKLQGQPNGTGHTSSGTAGRKDR